MRFIVNSSELSKSLQSISGVISTSSTVPILDHFLFNLDGETLKITASDLETTMIVTLKLDNAIQEDAENGTIAIPAKILLETLKTFDNIPLNFNVNTENYAVEISTGEGKYKLTGQNGNEYPSLPVSENTTRTILLSSVIATAINKTLFAAGTDELRPVMSGVFCELTPDDVTFVATDAHKLVRYRRTDSKSDHSASFILPKKPLNQLKGILGSRKEDTEVVIEYNQVNSFFTFENYLLICRLIDGKYPNYEAVIPKNNPNQLIVDRLQILNSIKRIAIFANQSTHQVRFKINGQELVLSAEDLDYSNEAKERLTCNYDGESMEIGFNSKYIQEMLNNIDCENIRFEMSQPNRAGLIMPEEKENESEDILMLVMPVMLNQ